VSGAHQIAWEVSFISEFDMAKYKPTAVDLGVHNFVGIRINIVNLERGITTSAMQN
jgi:hypothetical protein